MTAKLYYDRMAGCRSKFQATIRNHRWGLLWDEFRAQGWKPAKVHPRTGERVRDGEKGIWVMRYVGFGDDDAVRFAKRCGQRVKVRSRELRPGEVW
jgi:hypothetical protein